MRYRLTCLTPVLAGDGHKLSPIDYMVWKDHVNVLDQRRIFRLLAKGPRLDGYLSQLRKADKLDFASWGGFAQNFADRRIPFEHPSTAVYWEQAKGESLYIPTFASGIGGPYFPGSAIKGALRTGMLYSRWKESDFQNLVSPQGDRPFRRPGEAAEQRALGPSGASLMRGIGVTDSAAVPVSSLRIYLLRVSTLQPNRGAGYDLAWKQAPRGSVEGSRPGESTPIFAEMAGPGTIFEGHWRDNAYLEQREVMRALRWRESANHCRVFEAANQYAARLLEIQKQYAEWAGLPMVGESVEQIRAQLPAGNPDACLISLGWGSGLLAKTGWLDTAGAQYRDFMRDIPWYGKGLKANLPFPKTRKILFLGDKPAALPGWALLEVFKQD